VVLQVVVRVGRLCGLAYSRTDMHSRYGRLVDDNRETIGFGV